MRELYGMQEEEKLTSYLGNALLKLIPGKENEKMTSGEG